MPRTREGNNANKEPVRIVNGIFLVENEKLKGMLHGFQEIYSIANNGIHLKRVIASRLCLSQAYDRKWTMLSSPMVVAFEEKIYWECDMVIINNRK